jgi:hypothetical protein
MGMIAAVETALSAQRAGSSRPDPFSTLRFVDRVDVIQFHTGSETRGGRSSGFGRMSDLAGRLSGQRSDILGQLLRATCETVEMERSAFKPIWAFENFARAGVLVRLLLGLDRLRKSGSPYMLTADMERDAADRLSAGLCLLKDLSARGPAPCSAVLRHVARDLVELFGPTVGDVAVATQIEPLTMTHVKRRALVLLTCNLLLHSVADGYAGRSGGMVLVALIHVGGSRARLTVADDGCVRDRELSREVREALDDLAAILGGTLVSRQDARGGMISELTFPVVEHLGPRISRLM